MVPEMRNNVGPKSAVSNLEEITLQLAHCFLPCNIPCRAIYHAMQYAIPCNIPCHAMHHPYLFGCLRTPFLLTLVVRNRCFIYIDPYSIVQAEACGIHVCHPQEEHLHLQGLAEVWFRLFYLFSKFWAQFLEPKFRSQDIKSYTFA